jgi:hypothetical protein
LDILQGSVKGIFPIDGPAVDMGEDIFILFTQDQIGKKIFRLGPGGRSRWEKGN